MAYEYQESDIIFSEHEHQGGGEDINSSYYIWSPHPQRKSSADGGRPRSRSKKLRGNHTSSSSSSSSLPISIPERDHFQWGIESEEGWEGGGEVVPPHLIVARRVAGKMEFSVCSGKGRTLKGRDLKEVRNEILRMTGFLEA